MAMGSGPMGWALQGGWVIGARFGDEMFCLISGHAGHDSGGDDCTRAQWSEHEKQVEQASQFVGAFDLLRMELRCLFSERA